MVFVNSLCLKALARYFDATSVHGLGFNSFVDEGRLASWLGADFGFFY